MTVLSFEGVTRRYGDVVALNHIDLALDAGITALVGPNGAGKSTFMRVATGHVRPTLGRVRAFGQTVWDNPAIMRRVGYVPEQDAFYEFMTGKEFVATLATLNGLSDQQAATAAEDELVSLGLTEGMDRPIRTYSKGMRQRVKLAQALLHRPDLLFLDEPLLGCDPVARRRIHDRVRALRNEGVTVIISSHILPEVERITKDVAVIAGGRLVASGDVGSVRDALGSVPSRVRITTSAPRPLAQWLTGWDEVDAVHVEADHVLVETPGMSGFLRRLRDQATPERGIEGVQTMDVDLDSLFGYLTGGAGWN